MRRDEGPRSGAEMECGGRRQRGDERVEELADIHTKLRWGGALDGKSKSSYVSLIAPHRQFLCAGAMHVRHGTDGDHHSRVGVLFNDMLLVAIARMPTTDSKLYTTFRQLMFTD